MCNCTSAEKISFLSISLSALSFKASTLSLVLIALKQRSGKKRDFTRIVCWVCYFSVQYFSATGGRNHNGKLQSRVRNAELQLTFKSSRKYGLHADRTTRCAFKLRPSQANVTSTKSSSSRRFSNADVMLL